MKISIPTSKFNFVMKKLLIITSFGALFLFIIGFGLFCYVNSGSFVENVVLQKLAQSLDTEIQSAQIEFSLFSGIHMQGLRLGDAKNPFLVASNLRITHDFFPLFRGKLHIEECTLENPRIHVFENEYGEFNVPSVEAGTGTKSSLFFPLFHLSKCEIKAISVKNFSYIYEKESGRNQAEKLMEISNLNFTLDHYILDKPFEISGKGLVTLNNEIREESLKGKLSFTVNGKVGENFFPEEFNLACSLDEISGNSGGFTLKNRTLQWDLRMQKKIGGYQVKHCHLSESHNKKIEAFLSLTGSLSLSPLTLDLDLVIKTEKSDFLRRISAFLNGVHLGEGSFYYTGKITHGHQPFLTSIQGELSMENYSIMPFAQKISELPPLKGSLIHRISWDSSQRILRLQELEIQMEESIGEIMNLSLEKPLTIDIGDPKHPKSVTSKLTFSAKNFNALYVTPFIPKYSDLEISGGKWNQSLTVNLFESGKEIQIEGHIHIDNAFFSFKGHEFNGIGLDSFFQVVLQENMSHAVINGVETKIWVDNEIAGACTLSGNYDLERMEGSIFVDELKICPSLQEVIPESLFSFSSPKNFNCGGNLEIEYRGNKGFEFMGSVSSENLQMFTTVESQTLTFSPTWTFEIESIFDGPITLKRNVLTFNRGEEYVGSITFSGQLDYLESSGIIQANGNIGRIFNLIPQPSRLRFPEGEFSSELELKFKDVERELFCKGAVNFSKVAIKDPLLPEQSPVKFDLETNLDFLHKIGQHTTMQNSSLKIARDGENLLNLNVFGKLFPLSSPKLSNITLQSVSPVIAEPLLELGSILKSWRSRPQAPDAAESKTSNETINDGINKTVFKEKENSQFGALTTEVEENPENPEDSERSSPKMAINFDLPEILFDHFQVKDVIGSIFIQNKEVKIVPLTCVVNQGKVDFDGSLNYNKSDGYVYKGKISLENLEIEPIIASLNLETPLDIEGLFKEFSMEFKGKKSSFPNWYDNLKADISGKLKNVNLSHCLKKYNPIWGFLGLSHSNFMFDSIETCFEIRDGHSIFETFEAHGPSLKILPSGRLELGRKWLPNLSLILGYNKEQKNILDEKNIKVTQGEDGYYYTDILPLAIASWEKSDLIQSWLPSFSASLLDLDPETEALGFGIKSLGKILLGETTLPEAAGGFLGVLHNTEKRRTEKNNPNSATDPKSSPDRYPQ